MGKNYDMKLIFYHKLTVIFKVLNRTVFENLTNIVGLTDGLPVCMYGNLSSFKWHSLDLF